MFIEEYGKLKRCTAASGCERMAKFCLTFGKYPERKIVYLCTDCFSKLHQEINKNLVPKPVKTKFKNF